MGILGARSLLDGDPSRYGRPWRCNWDDGEGEDNNNENNKEVDEGAKEKKGEKVKDNDDKETKEEKTEDKDNSETETEQETDEEKGEKKKKDETSKETDESNKEKKEKKAEDQTEADEEVKEEETEDKVEADEKMKEKKATEKEESNKEAIEESSEDKDEPDKEMREEKAEDANGADKEMKEEQAKGIAAVDKETEEEQAGDKVETDNKEMKEEQAEDKADGIAVAEKQKEEQKAQDQDKADTEMAEEKALDQDEGEKQKGEEKADDIAVAEQQKEERLAKDKDEAGKEMEAEKARDKDKVKKEEKAADDKDEAAKEMEEEKADDIAEAEKQQEEKATEDKDEADKELKEEKATEDKNEADTVMKEEKATEDKNEADTVMKEEKVLDEGEAEKQKGVEKADDIAEAETQKEEKETLDKVEADKEMEEEKAQVKAEAVTEMKVEKDEADKEIKEAAAEDKDESGKEQKGEDGGPIHLLIDGMSLLYHVAVHQNSAREDSTPAAVKDRVSSYISQLLQALPNNSEIRIFMDGLAPKAKIATQVSRLRDQAIKGDTLAKANKTGKKSGVKLLDLLAEFALVEAIEDLCRTLAKQRPDKILALHRPSRGEAEAYIDYWISRKLPKDANVCILADDSDFLVYPACPGFVSFQSLEIKEEGDQIRLSGFQVIRHLFLESFLPSGVMNDDIMPVVAALAGCDYVLHSDAQQGLEKARDAIVRSDIGGLREKARNKPSKAQTLTAILRFVGHFIKLDRDNWVHAMIEEATNPTNKSLNGNGKKSAEEKDPSAKNRAATILTDAFIAIRKIYFRSLTLPTNPEFEKKPSSLEIRRLLEYGILYCRPIVESWEPTHYVPPRKRSLDEINTAVDSSSYAMVISPPFTRQIASWIEQDSIWRMPHFCQARLRLYCLLVQFARTGGSYSFEGGQLRLSPMWTNENPKVIEYIRSNNNGGKDRQGEPSVRMLEREMDIPTYEHISAGWGDESELLSGDDAVDRACLFCLIGNIKQARPGLNPSLRPFGTLFLASLLLPFNLALLLILLGTSPSLEDVKFRPSEAKVSAEMKRVLPFMSVACYHAIFIANTLSSLYGTHSEEQRRSNLTVRDDGNPMGINVSSTLHHDEALWIWRALRQGADLEQLKSDDSDDAEEMQYAMEYLEDAIKLLQEEVPQNDEWQKKMKEWKQRAKILWVIWWEVFNVALTTESSTNINDW